MRCVFGLATALVILCAACAGAGPAAGIRFPDVIGLPAGFAPEGIAIGSRPVAYLGSRLDGTIYRVDLATGAGAVLSPGPGTPSLGLAVDGDRLFVAGGAAADARVIDIGAGSVSATYRLGSADSFVNDVVLTPAGAWFTDSHLPVLYHLPFGPGGSLPRESEVVRLPLTGAIEYVAEAINANGIVRTPDGAGLIIVQSVTGLLFRVDPMTGATKRIALGTESVPSGDGLLWYEGGLLVVQNRLGTVARVRLDGAAERGTLERRYRDPRFDVPTTIAAFADRLYLPNARFTTIPGPSTAYDVVAIGR
ncbi:superoxide dismutase [Nocardia sp. NPDC004568]|uniref:SMP-30/gluconolactonase/LRE family protein n=1 Tax=Nocardia sp. NPDC004568 TaxID=3154551 RepID=UPI0033AB44D6